MSPVIYCLIALVFLWCSHLWTTREDITRLDTGELYLRRFFLWKGAYGKPRLLLHKFYRGDEDPHLHDHPWSFTSLILTRGYWEETPFEQPNNDDVNRRQVKWMRRDEATGEDRRRVFYRPFSLLHRSAWWRHRVILEDKKPVWTLVLTGPKERDWGFWIKNTLCPWRNYENGVCWCGDEASPQN